MALFYQAPQCSKTAFNVGDVLKQLPEFNAAYEVTPTGSVGNTTWSEKDKVNWRTQVREGVIMCGNGGVELDFFERMIGGTPTTLSATEYWTKYNCDREYNIMAEGAITGSAPGAATTFQMHRSFHSLDGKYSNAVIGGSIYIYEDRQFARITAIDTTADYAHQITVVPYKVAYQVNIRAGKKMMFNPVRHTDGYTCSIPNSTWENPAYQKKWTPFRVRKDWEMPTKLDGPYTDIMQFHFIFDKDGKEMDSFEVLNKTRAREELQAMKNLDFFLGQKIDNPLILGLWNDAQYTGFEGLLPTLRYGGGGIYDFDPAIGFDIDADFQSLILQQDATKRTKEFVLMGGINFMMGMTDRSNDLFKNFAGACNFETFVRSGAGKADIEKLSVRSINYMGYSIHAKQVEAWSDTRYLGNYDMPNMGILMPGNGLVDSKGRSVSAIEFFNVAGPNQPATMESATRNHFDQESGCEKLSGSIIENYMMAIHCPNQWVLLNPTMSA